MNGISIHVLDNSRGRPGPGIDVALEFESVNGWEARGNGTTGDDGRIGSLLAEGEELVTGNYRLIFDTGSYYRLKGQEHFFPQVIVVFEVADAEEHYHIPLLLSAFGYATYRGG